MLSVPPSSQLIGSFRQKKGVVSDSNAFALGGISGHAGFFANIYDVSAIVNSLMSAPESTGPNALINRTTVELFTQVWDVTKSSRALGWDTNAVNSQYHFCGSLSAATFTHTGFTGTIICADPVREMYTVFLSNRVYPDDTNQKIFGVRRDFHNAVQQVFDANFAWNQTPPPM